MHLRTLARASIYRALCLKTPRKQDREKLEELSKMLEGAASPIPSFNLSDEEKHDFACPPARYVFLRSIANYMSATRPMRSATCCFVIHRVATQRCLAVNSCGWCLLSARFEQEEIFAALGTNILHVNRRHDSEDGESSEEEEVDEAEKRVDKSLRETTECETETCRNDTSEQCPACVFITPTRCCKGCVCNICGEENEQ